MSKKQKKESGKNQFTKELSDQLMLSSIKDKILNFFGTVQDKN